jgi:tripartite-type tricarboxylate transporter receptor subunit TctC
MTAARISRPSLFRLLMAALVAAAILHTPAVRAEYPEKPIRLIVPFPAGGPSDVLARAIAQKLNVRFNQAVIAENKPGAGTNLAAEFVAKSPADGYTLLLMMIGTQAINEAMYPKLGYSTVRDFAPISSLGCGEKSQGAGGACQG